MTSLRDYLKTRLLILGLVLLVPILFLLFSLYELGLDDATELYLQQDLEWAIASLNHTQALPPEQPHKVFALGTEDLPALYHSVARSLPDDPYLFLQSGDVIHYGIVGEWQGEMVFVIHQFPAEEPIEGIQLETIAMLAITGILCVMAIGAWLMYRRISIAMVALEQVVSGNKTTAHNMALAQASGNTEEAIIWFSEVYEVSRALRNAVTQLQDKNQQEHAFIQSLSHELRTPMAIIQVALDVLGKQPLSDNVSSKLSTINAANQRMQTLSSQLLGVWQTQPDTAGDAISMVLHIEQAIESLNDQYGCGDRIQFEPREDITLVGFPLAVQLLVLNLLKNAVIHGVGAVEVALSRTGFQVRNGIKGKSHGQDHSESIGMGLIIVAKAVEVLGWRLVETSTAEEYCVNVWFGEAE